MLINGRGVVGFRHKGVPLSHARGPLIPPGRNPLPGLPPRFQTGNPSPQPTVLTLTKDS